MSERIDYRAVAVGALVLAAAAVAVLAGLWLAGSGTLRGERHSYVVQLPDSGGVRAGDEVRVHGVAVGRVQEVTLSPQRRRPVSVDVSIDAGVRLTEGASAQLARTGMLGRWYLAIEPGAGERLPAGSAIPGKPSYGLDRAIRELSRVSERIVELSGEITRTVERVRRDVVPRVNRGLERIPDLVAGMQETVGGMRAIVERLGSALGPDGRELREPLRRAETVLRDLDLALGEDGARVRALLGDARGLMDDASTAATAIGDQRGAIEGLLSDLSELTAELRGFAREIRRHPHRLLRAGEPETRRPGDPSEGD